MNKLEMIEENMKKNEDILNKENNGKRLLNENINLEPLEEREIQGLTIGKYKNFKKVCIASGFLEAEAPAPKGNTKKKLEMQLSTICKWRKVEKGQAIFIDEVYNKQLQKIDKRKNNKGNGKKSIYYQDFEILMLHLLEKEPNEFLNFTITKLMEMIGMINSDYRKYKYSKKLLAEEEGISIKEINQFYEVHQNLLSQGARTCLNNLKKANLIHMEEITMIKGFEIVKLSGVNNSERRIYFYREATNEEKKKIFVEKRKLIESMECKNMNEVYKKKLNLMFYMKLRVILEEKYKISFDYTSYSIVLNKEVITDELKIIKEIASIDDLKYSINSKSYKKSINDYNKKGIQRVEVRENFSNLEINAKTLSDKLISI